MAFTIYVYVTLSLRVTVVVVTLPLLRFTLVTTFTHWMIHHHLYHTPYTLPTPTHTCHAIHCPCLPTVHDVTLLLFVVRYLPGTDLPRDLRDSTHALTITFVVTILPYPFTCCPFDLLEIHLTGDVPHVLVVVHSVHLPAILPGLRYVCSLLRSLLGYVTLRWSYDFRAVCVHVADFVRYAPIHVYWAHIQFLLLLRFTFVPRFSISFPTFSRTTRDFTI